MRAPMALLLSKSSRMLYQRNENCSSPPFATPLWFFSHEDCDWVGNKYFRPFATHRKVHEVLAQLSHKHCPDSSGVTRIGCRALQQFLQFKVQTVKRRLQYLKANSLKQSL